MAKIVILGGVYGLRDNKGRVRPVARGETVEVPQAEAARLAALGVAVCVEDDKTAPVAVPAATVEVPEQAEVSEAGPVQEAPVEPPSEEEIARLERLPKADLEQMAQDMCLDVSEAKNKREMAELIAAADAEIL